MVWKITVKTRREQKQACGNSAHGDCRDLDIRPNLLPKLVPSKGIGCDSDMASSGSVASHRQNLRASVASAVIAITLVHRTIIEPCVVEFERQAECLAFQIPSNISIAHQHRRRLRDN